MRTCGWCYRSRSWLSKLYHLFKVDMYIWIRLGTAPGSCKVVRGGWRWWWACLGCLCHRLCKSIRFWFDINREYNAPRVLSSDSTLMHWSSNLTKSTDMDDDNCSVIVYSSAMPANSPWKNVVILKSLFCSYLYSMCISASNESTVKFSYSYFYWWVYFMCV